MRIISGFGPGAAGDIVARVVARNLSANLGQAFIVENRPGAGSNIATELVARAPRDGYTLLMASTANTINTSLTPDTPFNFATDLTPIALVATTPLVLVVHPSVGATSVQELIALARSNPEHIFFGSSGFGTAPHLSGELFKQMTGVKMVHVPYQGSAQAVNDLLAGHVQVMFSPASTVMPSVAAGKLRAIASTESKRASIAPDLPTMEEAGLAGFHAGVWLGLMAPAGTSSDITRRLALAINDALNAQDVLSSFKAQGIEPLGGTPEEFAQFLKLDTDKWEKIAYGAALKK